MPLAFRERKGIFSQHEGRNRLIQALLIIAGRERLGKRLALGIADIFQHLLAQTALDEAGQALAEFRQIRPDLQVLLAERLFIAEQVFINQCGQAK